MAPILHVGVFLLLLIPTYVTWRLIVHRERIAAVFSGAAAVGMLALQPVVHIAADEWWARPRAESLKVKADQVMLKGKDYKFVIATLGEPKRSRFESPVITRNADAVVVQRMDSYTALEYYPSDLIAFSTRFLVFLDDRGIVTNYRVKWERDSRANKSLQQMAEH